MTATAVLDDLTAGAIRRAIGAASMGRLSEACRIGELALTDGGDPAALHAMLGMFRCQAREFDRGIEHLRLAHQSRAEDQKILSNLVSALAAQGLHAEALQVLTREKAARDPSATLERQRAFLAQSVENYPEAVASYERVVQAFPDDWEAWNNLGNVRRMAADFDGSVAALRRAADLQPNSPPVRLNLAIAIGAAGDVAEAERQLRSLADEHPDQTPPLRELKALLREQGREEEALSLAEEAVERDPSDVSLLTELAGQQLLLLRYDAAETSYRKAIAMQPDNGFANLGLALVYELTNRIDALMDLVDQAAARKVDTASSSFIQALAHRRAKRFDEGLRALEQVPDDLETVRRVHLRAQLLEGAGRHDEAFADYSAMNALAADDRSEPKRRGQAYRDRLRASRGIVTSEWVGGWRKESVADERPSPVFLVGFPRSGTTLLDTMLMGHPQIEVLEEEPAVREASLVLKDLASLPTAPDELIREARDAYFRCASSLTPLKAGNLLIDKNPLTMNQLPLVRRLFPDARIILALRHPCDVVLSCFVTNFRTNEGMASFLSLDTAAELYDLSFSYLEQVQELMQFPMHRVVYENVVADRETELRSLFGFLGLDWHDDVLKHEQTALGRGRIKTASYAQVVEPIYTRSKGRWENFRSHLEPVLPVLKPWIDKFGYPL